MRHGNSIPAVAPAYNPPPMREYRIAAIPGDGIGIEVIAAGLKVLDVLAQRDGG